MKNKNKDKSVNNLIKAQLSLIDKEIEFNEEKNNIQDTLVNDEQINTQSIDNKETIINQNIDENVTNDDSQITNEALVVGQNVSENCPETISNKESTNVDELIGKPTIETIKEGDIAEAKFLHENESVNDSFMDKNENIELDAQALSNEILNNLKNVEQNDSSAQGNDVVTHDVQTNELVQESDAKEAKKLVEEIKQECSKKKKNIESLSAKQKAKLEYKALSKEDKKALKQRAKQIEALNKPHKGPKDVTMSENNVIELKDVVKYYTNGYVVTKILKGINLSIPKGSFVIILGPSGSGKTTLMNILSGLDRASEGQVYVAGKDLITLNHKELTKFRKDNVGYVFQQYGLIPNLTVRENIEIGADLQADKSKRLNVDELLDAVGMKAYENKFPHQLSGGQQQRVSIARAFAKNPAILFGDEPTGAIDEEMSKVVLKQFVAINKKHGTTVIMVTHNPIFQGLGDIVIKVKDGLVSQIIHNKNPKTVDELPWGME